MRQRKHFTFLALKMEGVVEMEGVVQRRRRRRMKEL
jgi:hypothetical protein